MNITHLTEVMFDQQAIDVVMGIHRRTLIQGEREHLGKSGVHEPIIVSQDSHSRQ